MHPFYGYCVTKGIFIVRTIALCDDVIVTGCVEFCQEVTDQQMPHVAPIIFPQLLQVIAQPQVDVRCSQL